MDILFSRSPARTKGQRKYSSFGRSKQSPGATIGASIISQINNTGRCKREVSSRARWGESEERKRGARRERARKREGGKTKGVARAGQRHARSLARPRTNAYAQAPTSQLVKNSCGRNVDKAADELNVRLPRAVARKASEFLHPVSLARAPRGRRRSTPMRGDYHGDCYCAR